MQTTLTAPDKKADKIVKIKVSETFCDQVAASGDEGFYQTAEEFYEGLKRAIHDVNEHIAGRKELRTLEEFLDEYQSRADC